jgi:hypothetical protein
MMMPPAMRKSMLMIHVTSSVGLLGAIAAFLALAIIGLSSDNDMMLRSAYLAMQPITRFVIVPLAMATLTSGIVQSLGTSWGLFRHYWVVVKLLITVFAVTILLIKTALIAEAAKLAAEAILPLAELRAAGAQLAFHAAAGLLVLLVPMVLSIMKPAGKTSYGWRIANDSRC